MPFAFDRLYQRLGRRYFALYVAFQVVSSLVVTLATIGLFALYEDPGEESFWRIFAFASVFVLLALWWTDRNALRLLRPVLRWEEAGRGREGAEEAWRAAVGLPRAFVTRYGWKPFAVVSLPIAAGISIGEELPWYIGGVLFLAALVSVAYSAILHFFASELALRPVLADIVRNLPPDFEGQPVGMPLRWKLLGSLPVINIVTGVVVSALSVDQRANLADLGLDVVVAVLVAFTISFELTVLLTKSILRPVDDLLQATERVRKGDLSARVPVVSGDEMGRLAGSFNAMLRGLEEREALREAFGSYVTPDVAERVLEEGVLLEGEEVEATLVFVDVRDFTAYAERASARESVSYLNDFFGLVVPLLEKHGGHANKFIGDGVLGVFGAPERHPDHPDRALAAACEIASEVPNRFGDRLEVAIGVNSGPVIAGSVGGGGRLEFTVIGDPVNVAARVESLAGERGEQVLITEATRCLLVRDDVEVEDRGSVTLKGKSDPIPVYAPIVASKPPRERQAEPARPSGPRG